MSPSHSNPFYQPSRQWQIRIFAQRRDIPAIEEAFADLVLSVSSFELSESTDEWVVDIVTDVPPENADIPARLALVSGLLQSPTPPCEVQLLEARDWVSEVERTFVPLHVGRFYVYGSHVTSAPPHGKIALRVNAGEAFGSGEHSTTSGCLLALGELAKRCRFSKPLDMGCGSGILAIAIAKLWKVPALGVDIDPVSVRVARENAVLNRVQGRAHFAAGNGYATPAVRTSSPYDLIVANILARPLMRMAPALHRHLAPGGMAVLSGLLDSQERMVLAAHRAQGLRLYERIALKGWNTLILGPH